MSSCLISHTWFKLLSVNWCVPDGSPWTWAIWTAVCRSVGSCCVRMCGAGWPFAVVGPSTMVWVTWLGATDTEIVCGCDDGGIWMCGWISCCDVDGISSGSFFTRRPGTVDAPLLGLPVEFQLLLLCATGEFRKKLRHTFAFFFYTRFCKVSQFQMAP